MKRLIFKKLLILIAGVTIISPWPVFAQYSNWPEPVWGAATNGINLGLRIGEVKEMRENDSYCEIDMKNMSTNRLYIWVPPLERRYEIELLGPDGRRIRQLKPFSLSHQNPWLALEPLSAKHGNWVSLDWCFIKDTFDMRTNGLYTLIVSARVNVFTNFSIGHSQMRSEPVYFLLPPVTNTFNISPEQLKK